MSEFVLNVGKHIAKGTEKLVFQHPIDPNLLIKVIRPEEQIERSKGPVFRPYKKRFGIYYSWQRELEELNAITMRLGLIPDYLQTYHGLCSTNLGLGMVVGKVTDHANNLAPSMEILAARGQLSGATFHPLIDELVANLIESKCIVWDLLAKNIVVTGPANKEKLVLIDGLGDRTVIPLRRMFYGALKKSLGQKQAELHAWINENCTP